MPMLSYEVGKGACVTNTLDKEISGGCHVVGAARSEGCAMISRTCIVCNVQACMLCMLAKQCRSLLQAHCFEGVLLPSML